MSRVEEIEAAIDGLPAEEYRRIVQWFRVREQRRWDEQMDADSLTGKLDFLFHEAEGESAGGFLQESRRKLSKTRHCGTGVGVIQTDDQMLLAQQCIGNLRRILLGARKVHSRQDYARMAEPILLEVQQREQEILECLSRDLEQPITQG
jgi:hypothetical protein